MTEKTPINTSIHFGVPLYELDIPQFDQMRESLCRYFLELEKSQESLSLSNQGGWHSKTNLFQSSEPLLKSLTEIIHKYAVPCIVHAEGVKAEKIMMNTLWANINREGDWNAPHMHLPSEWSGVCYLAVNEDIERKKNVNDGDLILFDPYPLGIHHHRKPTTGIKPANGKMVIFPAYLLHMAAPHRGEEARISVAFNFTIKK